MSVYLSTAYLILGLKGIGEFLTYSLVHALTFTHEGLAVSASIISKRFEDFEQAILYRKLNR